MGVILAAGMLAGCSSGGDSAETTAAAAADTTAAAASGDTEAAEEGSGEAITLRFVSWQSNHAEGDQRIVDAWEAEHPDIQVEIEYLGDMNSNDYLQKTDLMLMGGEE